MPLDKDWYSRFILETCERVHGHCTGSGDGIGDAELVQIHEWMKRRYAEWQPSSGSNRFSKAYDDQVWNLLGATIDLLEDWDEKERKRIRVGDSGVPFEAKDEPKEGA